MGILERTPAYRAWMAPFAERKFAPVKGANDLSAVRSVLDVGCGPGTNTPHFEHADYLGIDVNPAYIESARERFGRDFIVADVNSFEPPDGRRFDFVLVNSLLHHLPDDEVRALLARTAELVDAGGHVHVLELVQPQRPSPARLLARLDRGDYARPMAEWDRLLGESLEAVHRERYTLGLPGAVLWNMVYVKARPRR